MISASTCDHAARFFRRGADDRFPESLALIGLAVIAASEKFS
jgi:hypothetical protein